MRSRDRIWNALTRGPTALRPQRLCRPINPRLTLAASVTFLFAPLRLLRKVMPAPFGVATTSHPWIVNPIRGPPTGPSQPHFPTTIQREDAVVGGDGALSVPHLSAASANGPKEAPGESVSYCQKGRLPRGMVEGLQ